MKKLQRLTIENFQSHEFTQIDFSPGFNVIVGQSDQGKSALIRALKWLIYNEPRGVDFIRVGATRSSVTILLTDGTQITRERTPSRNRYYLLIPGQEENIFEGFGSRVPQEIQDALGMGKSKIGRRPGKDVEFRRTAGGTLSSCGNWFCSARPSAVCTGCISLMLPYEKQCGI